MPASAEEEGETDCEVMTRLYLMCPDTVKRNVDIILVNDDNVILCLDLWKKSSIFDFDRAFQIILRDGTSCALGILFVDEYFIDFLVSLHLLQYSC